MPASNISRTNAVANGHLLAELSTGRRARRDAPRNSSLRRTGESNPPDAGSSRQPFLEFHLGMRYHHEGCPGKPRAIQKLARAMYIWPIQRTSPAAETGGAANDLRGLAMSYQTGNTR